MNPVLQSSARSRYPLSNHGVIKLCFILIFSWILYFSSNQAFSRDFDSLTTVDIEELLSKEVTTTSKLAQQVSETPSAVSIVTSKDIKSYGYRTLAEIINSMRGLNTINDHVYTYMSGRGFGRPGDYPGRVMLLVDGYQANDNLYNASYLGNDGLIDADLIERVEYVSGPGSVIYGNGAFYGIINVITKKGANFRKTQIAQEFQSNDGYRTRLTYGNSFDNGADMLLSVSGYSSRGKDWYFSEFDSPANNNGVANNLDDERNRRIFLKGSYQNWQLESAYVTRRKDDPAASYGTDFNTPPTFMEDKNGFVHLKYEGDISDTLKSAYRLYYGQYNYYAKANYAAEPYKERNTGRWWGTEAKFVDTSYDQHTMVYGLEYRNDYQQDFYLPGVNIENSIYMMSGYFQDQYTYNNHLSFNLGARLDYGGAHASAISPRVALIYSPFEKFCLKASYATAFRRANAYEKYYDDGAATQIENPHVDKERVRATELVLEYQPDNTSRILGSLYYYKTLDLIQVQDITGSSGILQATNIDRNQTHGFDVEYEKKLSSLSNFRMSYAWQKATDENDKWIANSPKHLAKLNYFQALLNNNLHAGLELQYVGKRLTEQRNKLGSYTVANFTVYNDNWIKNTTISFSAKNIFDKAYSTPAPDFYSVERFQQDSANYWLQVTYDIR